MAEYIEREALIKAIKVHETAENDRIETGYNWALDDIALKLLRKYKGLTQKDLAKQIGCCEQSIAAYEKGKTFPSTQILHKLAIFFDMPENDLFYENAICPCCGRRLE